MDNLSNSLPNGKDNMASMLKEMLKIGGSADSSLQEQRNHIGAGDAVGHSNKESVARSDCSTDTASEKALDDDNNIPSGNALQTIMLDEVLDGECVELIGTETKIVSSANTELDSTTSASNKVKTSTVTKFDWEHRYYPGNLISVTNLYMAYSIKGRISNSVRVINRQNSSDRVLLKGFSGFVTDVAFSHSSSSTLAAVDDMGNLMIWNLDQVAGNMIPELKLHITRENVETPVTHRLVWIPNVSTDHSEDENANFDASKSDNSESDVHTLVLFYKTEAEVWDLEIAYQVTTTKNNLKITRSDASHAFVTVNDYDDEITDCELSPVGNVLAAASYDGYVKFWKVQIEDTEPPGCLHKWQPHDGNPVTAIRFCDDKKQSELSAWSIGHLVELIVPKSLFALISWVIKFTPPTPAHSVPEMNLVLHHSADFLVLSDIHRKVLYVMQMQSDLERGHAHISSIAYFKLTSPLLSIAMVDAKQCKFKNQSSKESTEVDEINLECESEGESHEKDIKVVDEDKSNGILVQLLTIQQKCLQNLDVRFVPCETLAGGDLSGATCNTSTDDLKDHISLSSADERELLLVSKSPLDQHFHAAGDGLASPAKFSPASGDDVTEQVSQPGTPSPSVEKASSSLEKIDIAKAHTTTDSPHSTTVSTPTVLLTPDAFTQPSSSRKVDETINTSFTSVTPFSNAAASLYQHQDMEVSYVDAQSKASLLNLSNAVSSASLKEEASEEGMKTPPSSPIQPQATSSPPTQAAAAAEILQSFCSTARSSVKSPDLISSTASVDDTKHDFSVPSPGLSKRIAPTSTAMLPEQADVFSIAPVSSSDPTSAWPKAPDVTMSHPLASKSSQSSSIQPITIQPIGSDEVSTSREVKISRESPLVVALPVEPPEHEVVLKSIKDFQEKQESLLNEQQRKLDAIAKKQNQTHKQGDAAIKRSDQQVDRLEKSIKSLGDNHRRLASDIKTNHSAMTDAAVAKIDRAVKSEMKRTILPGVTSCIDEMKNQLSTSVAKQLTATDAVLKETMGKQVKSKEFVNAIASETSKILIEQIQSSLQDILLRTVVPSFERSCQNMFQQLSTTYHRGMEESVKQSEKQMQYRLRNEYDKMQQVTKEANEAITQLQTATKTAQSSLTTNIHKQFSESIEKLLNGFEEKLTSNILQSIKRQQSKEQAENSRLICDAVRDVVEKTMEEKLQASKLNSSDAFSANAAPSQAPGVMQQSNVFDQQQQILKLLLQGKYNTAFQTALTAADLNLVMYVCETVEPSAVFGVSPCPLQQPILLSLIQQLSSDLSTKTAIKLKYLQEAVMNLDCRHQVTQEYMHSVLGALVQSLTSCLQRPLENLALSKDIKMLAMAAQSLMK